MCFFWRLRCHPPRSITLGGEEFCVLAAPTDEAGAQVVQLFDTWAGLLSPEEARARAARSRALMKLVQDLVDLGGHSHMFCFFPEEGSLMDHLPATPRDQSRRLQLARYLIDYRDVRVEQMKFDDQGRVTAFGIPQAELDDVIDDGIAFRTSGCPGKFQDDISACDRPYGDSPPSDIASYPFQPKKKDLKKIRRQLDIPVAVE